MSVSVLLPYLYGMQAPYYVVTCDLPGLCHERHNFLKEMYWTKNVCFDFLYKFV